MEIEQAKDIFQCKLTFKEKILLRKVTKNEKYTISNKWNRYYGGLHYYGLTQFCEERVEEYHTAYTRINTDMIELTEKGKRYVLYKRENFITLTSLWVPIIISVISIVFSIYNTYSDNKFKNTNEELQERFEYIEKQVTDLLNR